MGLSSRVTAFGSLSARLLRLLSVPVAPTAEPVGKLDRLPRPGLRTLRLPADRGMESRLENSLAVGAGVGVGVGEPSETVVSGGGGLKEPEEALALTGTEPGEPVDVPLVSTSSASGWVLIVGGWLTLLGDSLVGTSKLAPRPVARRSAGLVTLIGNRPVSDAPLERSRR